MQLTRQCSRYYRESSMNTQFHPLRYYPRRRDVITGGCYSASLPSPVPLAAVRAVSPGMKGMGLGGVQVHPGKVVEKDVTRWRRGGAQYAIRTEAPPIHVE